MTTNRILTIDVAVQSRIHYAIRFDALDAKRCQKVVDTFLKQLAEDNDNIEEEDKEAIKSYFEENIEELAQEGFNGRELRNLFSTAQLLAFQGLKKPKVTLAEFERVVKSTTSFRTDVQKVRDQQFNNTTAMAPSMYLQG